MNRDSNTRTLYVFPETVAQRRIIKKVFLKISKNSQESTCSGVYFLKKFLMKLLARGLQVC